MSNRTLTLTDELYQYVLSVSLREPELLRRLREETAQLPEHRMQISPEQGQFMALLVKLLSARRVVEVGTFTGYSALVMALALPAEGRLIACDVNETWTAIARRYWQEAGVAAKIDLRLAPAIATLDQLLAFGRGGTWRGTVDFVFIDADKTNYSLYFERALELVRPGGLIAIDNVLWSGKVLDQNERDADTEAIRRFNQERLADQRVSLSLLPIADGLTLALKHAP
jgi:caffeoyl-CoA O-methyltransferase